MPKKLFAIITVVYLLFIVGSYKKPYTMPFYTEYASPSVTPADLVIKNAKIVTIDKKNPRAEAVAVKSGFIIAVTSNKNIEMKLKQMLQQLLPLKVIQGILSKVSRSMFRL